MRKYAIALCLIAITTAIPGFAQQKQGLAVSAVATVDHPTITIGDKVTYTVTIKAPKQYEIKVPEFPENLTEFAIKDFGSDTSSWFGTKTITHWYVIDTYVAGTYTIPAATIQYRQSPSSAWQSVDTKSVTITVQSVLPKDASVTDIRDIKGPQPFPARLLWWLVGAGVVCLLAIGIFGLLWWIKRRTMVHITPLPRPAHEIAYEALRLLQAKGYVSQGQIKPYYSDLSDIIRHYIENRFSVRAPEMTTEEFLESLRAHDQLPLTTQQQQALEDFLTECDMVKFARYVPAQEAMQRALSAAHQFVDQTKEVGPP